MRQFHFPSLAALVLLLIIAAALPVGAWAADVVPESNPASSVSGSVTIDIILAIIGAINVLATALAALLPQNSAIGIVAKIADVANRLGLTLKPKAIQATQPGNDLK